MPTAATPIIIALGANLPSEFGPPRAALGAALERLAGAGLTILQRSPWYESAPVPVSDQPWYINGVCTVETALDPSQLLDLLLNAEAEMGRRRTVANAARFIDMDLIAYGDRVRRAPEPAPELPHPRMHTRAFVVLPLADLLPGWRHPVTGAGIGQLAAELPADQTIRKMTDAGGLFGTEWAGKAA